MSAPNTTPGPWVARNGRDMLWGEVLNEDGVFIARVHRRNDDNATGAECVANTRLVAAAPELYEELKRLVELLAETANYLGPFDHADRFAVLRAGVLTGRRTLKRARGE